MNLLKKNIKFAVIALILLATPVFMFNIYAKSRINIDDKQVFIDYHYTLAFVNLYNGNIEAAQKSYKKILPYLKKPRFYEEYTDMLLFLRKYGEAEKILKKAVNIFPKQKEFYDKLIDILIVEGNFSKALSQIKNYQKHFGRDGSFDKKLAVLYIKTKNYDKAIEYLKRILKKDRKNPEVYNYLSKCYLEKNNIKKATYYAEKSYKLDKTDISYALLLSDLYEQQKQYDKAIKIYKHMKVKTSSVYAAIGNDYYLMGQTKKALKYFKKAYESSKKNKYADRILYIYSKSNNYDKAVKFIENNKEKLLQKDRFKLLYGLALKERGLCKKAAKAFSTIKQSSEFYDEAVYNQAMCYKKLNKKEEAFKLLKKAAEKHPTTYYTISDLYIQYKEYKKAAENIEKNINRIKNKSKAYLYIADIYYTKLKNKKKAVKYLKKSLKENPKNASCLNYLGYLYIDENIDIDQGIKLVEQALKLKPKNPYYLDSLGWGYYKKKNYKEALKYLKKAKEQENGKYEYIDDEFTIEFHLVKTYLKLKQTKQAKKILEGILKKSPKNKKAEKLLNSIK